MLHRTEIVGEEPRMHDEKPLAFSMKECAVAVGISLRTLYTHLDKGNGPKTIRIGRRRLVTPDAARAWLESNVESR